MTIDDFFDRLTKCPYCNERFEGTLGQVMEDKIEHLKEAHSMTTRKCLGCKLYYPDMVWSHKVKFCPYCGQTIQNSDEYEYLTAEEKQAILELNEEKKEEA